MNLTEAKHTSLFCSIISYKQEKSVETWTRDVNHKEIADRVHVLMLFSRLGRLSQYKNASETL